MVVSACLHAAVASELEANVISTRNGADVHEKRGKYLLAPRDPTKDIRFIANV